MDGPVIFIHFDSTDEVSSIVNLKIELVDESNKCGQIRSAELTLCGFMTGVSWKPFIPEDITDEVEIEGSGFTLEDSEIYFDGLSALQAKQTGAMIFAIRGNETFVQGLVLKPADGEADKYVRLGIWRAKEQGILQRFQKLGQRVVTII